MTMSTIFKTKIQLTIKKMQEKTTMFRIVQYFICFFGMSLFVWASIGPGFRDVEGSITGSFCLPVSISVALIILGSTLFSRFKSSAFWFALALVGQAVTLQIIDAGPIVRYQHYKTFNRILTETHPLLMVFLVVQIVLVVAGFKRIWVDFRSWIGKRFKVWQLFAIGIVFVLSSATVSRDILTYIVELPFAAFIQIVNLGNILLMVWALPEDKLVFLSGKFERLFGQTRESCERGTGVVDRFAVLAVIWVTSLAIVLSLFAYERHPHIPDEVSYLYQAKYFSEGMISMPIPPVSDAFKLDLMTYGKNMWYSPFPPGWSAMLAVGVILGVPWLINPLLAGLNVLLAYTFIRNVYDRRTARISVLLLCVSPWYVFMAMNFMSHTFTITCSLLAALAVIRARITGRAIWGWIGGVSVGMVSLIRPLEGIIIAGLLGLWSIGLGGKRLRYSSITGLVLVPL